MASAAFTVTIGAATLTPPVITKHPDSQTITAGQTATFTVTASGNSLAYQWHKNSAPITGATAATHTIPNAQQSDAGSYIVTVSNPAGSVSSGAVLTVTTTTTTGGTPGGNPGGGSSGGGGGGGAPSLLYLAALALAALRALMRNTATHPAKK